MLVFTRLKRYNCIIIINSVFPCINAINQYEVGIYKKYNLTSFGRDYLFYLSPDKKNMGCYYFDGTHVDFIVDKQKTILSEISWKFPSKIMNTDIIAFYKDDFNKLECGIYRMPLNENITIIIENKIFEDRITITRLLNKEKWIEFILLYKKDILVKIAQIVDNRMTIYENST